MRKDLIIYSILVSIFFIWLTIKYLSGGLIVEEILTLTTILTMFFASFEERGGAKVFIGISILGLIIFIDMLIMGIFNIKFLIGIIFTLILGIGGLTVKIEKIKETEK